jgi:hypothetical protein
MTIRPRAGERQNWHKGTFDLRIVHTQSVQSMQADGTAQHLSAHSDGVFEVEQVSLCRALERLQKKQRH